ncbi:NAD(P)/FAD-dependent oxidoreductase, partial [Rubrivirga sp.]|uniref:NAD(P)/FAD-dependent oxidoreductase n=1 Tax=Rubrivirga sp. TaxID=1885344 RepID=UPI003C717B9E
MSSTHTSTDVVVIGGGAAGLMAAIFAGRAGARVIVLEKTRKGGKKIVVSGGGRCNVLPSVADERLFVTDSSRRLMGRILASWPLADQRRFFEDDLGIPLALEAETGKLFPVSNRATDVRDALVTAALEVGSVWFEADVSDLEGENGSWTTTLRSGQTISSRSVIVATGGLSVPKTGSDGWGLRLARQTGHLVEPTYAALAPLTADPAPHRDLSGVSVPHAHVRVP